MNVTRIFLCITTVTDVTSTFWISRLILRICKFIFDIDRSVSFGYYILYKMRVILMRTGSEKEILEAAIRVFAKTGYHGSSIQDITKEAGVSKALFYHYFKSKRDLLVIFARKRLEDFFPLAEQFPTNSWE